MEEEQVAGLRPWWRSGLVMKLTFLGVTAITDACGSAF